MKRMHNAGEMKLTNENQLELLTVTVYNEIMVIVAAVSALCGRRMRPERFN